MGHVMTPSSDESPPATAPAPRLWRILRAADSPTRGICLNLAILWGLTGLMLAGLVWSDSKAPDTDRTATSVLLVLASLVTLGYLVLSIHRVRFVREIFRHGETVQATIEKTEVLPGGRFSPRSSMVHCRYSTTAGESIEQKFVVPRRFARQLTSPLQLRIDRRQPQRAVIESEYRGR